MNGRRLLFVILAASVLCFAAIFAVRLLLPTGTRSVPPPSLETEYEPPQTPSVRVNINTASEEELQRLPGIGRLTAERITAYRESCGFFASAEELMAVQGVGENLFFKIKELIYTGDDNYEDTGS